MHSSSPNAPPDRRSLRPDTRNPVICLPAVDRLNALPPSARAALRAVLHEIADDDARRAETSWRSRKAPMATYWKAMAVYARHIARVMRPLSSSDLEPR